ncbi:MAG: oligopeptide transporter, OPT family [Gemmatimonadetes bacterium]|nr:oligopeptide transporter, OPT family [Gemmatimonadota bacterium]
MDEVPRRRSGLAPEAYEEVPPEQYPPYVPASESPREFTFRAVLIGLAIAVVFGAANAYLGLRVGLTVTASIPAAVIAVAALRVLGRGNVLEGNIIQTVGSSGESLAAGVIFTIPALFIWGMDVSQLQVFVLASLGGLLGVLFMIPLRRYLIVREHGRLPYPEGTAAAEVLAAGDSGGGKARLLFTGLGIGALYQVLNNPRALGLWQDEPTLPVTRLRTEAAVAVTPELLGIGYIVGPRIAAILLAGSLISWYVLIPLIALIGQNAATPMFPETERLIRDMAPGDLWNRYIRYVGAGSVAAGGIVTLMRSLPTMVSSVRAGVAGLREAGGAGVKRTDDDLPLPFVGGGVLAIGVVLALLPPTFMPVGVFGAALMLIFAFVFVTVSSRVVGLIGNSTNPISGMTIATLLFTSLLFVATGAAEAVDARVAILSVGAVVCIAASIAGDASQDLKTGFLLGSTPRKQQIGELIGVVVPATIMGAVLLLLHRGIGIGSEDLAAPQATLMALVIDGVIGGDLPWGLVAIGAAIALVVEMLGIPSLPLAVGIYLPLSLQTSIMAGGLVRMLVERRYRSGPIEVLREKRENGVLFASGLIAGAALVGVLIAGLVFAEKQGVGGLSGIAPALQNAAGTLPAVPSLLIFAGLALLLWVFAVRGHAGGEVRARSGGAGVGEI